MVEFDPFAAYNDLIDAVICSDEPNTHAGIPHSNAEMVDYICNALDIEYFDILEPVDFEDVFNNSQDANVVLAHVFLAHLRHDLFYSALRGKIGDDTLNKPGVVLSEYWALKLTDKMNAMTDGTKIFHKWLH